jgi:hypothetical protein
MGGVRNDSDFILRIDPSVDKIQGRFLRFDDSRWIVKGKIKEEKKFPV